MKIDHIHFFVDDAAQQRAWFIQCLGWTWVKQITLADRHVEVLRYRDTLFVLSSPRTAQGQVAEYLRQHPSGVVDIAIEVPDLSQPLSQLKPPAHPQQTLSPLLSHLVNLDQRTVPSAWASIQGWGTLRHTLIERQSLDSIGPSTEEPAVFEEINRQGIDHIVLNVPAGDLQAAVNFYQCLFSLQKQQRFNIQTKQSGLCSQVLFSPTSQLYFNINEPTSINSQIQTFLEANGGAGIQHIALHSDPIVDTVRTLRQSGLALLSVPLTYYEQLQQRLQLRPAVSLGYPEWQQIMAQQILVDWQPQQPESLLLQIFSRPVFHGNHFFFEFIERRQAVQGFGEGNFLALYKAIETEELNEMRQSSLMIGSGP